MGVGDWTGLWRSAGLPEREREILVCVAVIAQVVEAADLGRLPVEIQLWLLLKLTTVIELLLLFATVPFIACFAASVILVGNRVDSR